LRYQKMRKAGWGAGENTIYKKKNRKRSLGEKDELGSKREPIGIRRRVMTLREKGVHRGNSTKVEEGRSRIAKH